MQYSRSTQQLLSKLVYRLMCFQGVPQYDAKKEQLHARYVVSRRHFHVLKKAAEKLFLEGIRLYGRHLDGQAANKWRLAALLQHGPSHAFLSTLLLYGGTEVEQDVKQAFEVACAGAALGCSDSNGALADCLIRGGDIPEDVVRGLALAKKSAATGSRFGLFAYGMYFFVGKGVAYDDTETVRLLRLAAAQGHRRAKSLLSYIFEIEDLEQSSGHQNAKEEP